MTTKTNESNSAEPLVAKFCFGLGCMSLVGGPLLVVLAALSNAPQLMAPAFLVLFGSVLWFALSRIIILLAQIAHNTKGEREK